MVALSEKTEQQRVDMEIPILLDPTVLRAARRIYCTLNSRVSKRPFGVAINRDNHRGQLIFNNKPILLPGECFVPIKQIESEAY
jgi:hypothetical protein